jgi:g-D-glutamyl-meso-diaminopimelate peptidase
MQINGIKKADVLYERQIKMNKGSEDFSHWQANARGVDLNHNYNAGFYEYKRIERELGIDGGAPTRYSGEYPESEPEVQSLCNMIRALNVERIYSFHTQGEEIYYTSGETEPSESLEIGKKFEELCGYKLSRPEGPAAYGGLLDWAITRMKIPSFTFECGLGKNPLPFCDTDGIYEKIKEMLFCSLTI